MNRILRTALAAQLTVTSAIGPALPVVLAPLALAGCGTTGVDATQAIADAQIVVNGVASVYQTLLTIYPSAVSQSQQSTIAADLAAARAALAGLSANGAALTNATSLLGVENAINAVLNIVSGILPNIPGVPAPISAGVMAANVLLPLIEATINSLTGNAPKVTARVAAPAMSADQARLVLKAAAHQ